VTGPSDLAIYELYVSGSHPEAVDRFVEAHRFPIREGPHTTFVFRGEADSVLLGHWLFGTGAAREMERIPGCDVWFLTLDLPPESQVEYRFQRVRGIEAEWVLDPLNPRTVRDPFGTWSVCLVGDAWMSPYELTHTGGAIDYYHTNTVTGLDWLRKFRDRCPSSIWLNPEPKRIWNAPTIHLIRQVFPMFELTLDGLTEGIDVLRGIRPNRALAA